MRQEEISSSAMELHDELAETRLSIGSMLHGLEAIAGLPSVIQERGVALAALGARLADDAREQAERLYEEVQEHGRNGGGTPKRQKPGKTADMNPLQLKTKEKEG